MFKAAKKRFQQDERFRYLLVGIWNTAFAYLLFFVLYFLLHRFVHYLVIAVITYELSVANAFVCHRWLVFKSRGPLLAEFLRYNLTYLGALTWGLGGLMFCVEILGVPPLISQVFVSTVSIVVTFVLHKKYSFGRPGGSA
jgi:putative flippase GtrA